MSTKEKYGAYNGLQFHIEGCKALPKKEFIKTFSSQVEDVEDFYSKHGGKSKKSDKTE